MKQIIYLLGIIIPIALVSCVKPTTGCTDPYAVNFNGNADEDDGTCNYAEIIRGCTNPLSDNYDPAATMDDGSCVIRGCTDPTSSNYNPNATIDDGSCIDIREDFYGTWLVTNDCGFDFGLNDSLDVIQDSASSNTILFQYLGGDQNLNFAVIDGTDLEMEEQTLDGGFIPVTFTGEGEINDDGTEMTIDFTYQSFFGEQNCTAVLVKQ